MVLTNEQRSQIVAEAMTWLQTPFLDNQCLKGVGVDCGLFVSGVFTEVGLINESFPRTYSPQWYMHRSGEFLLKQVDRFCVEIAMGDVLPGDIILYRIGKIARNYNHIALVINLPQIIHAVPRLGVTLDNWDQLGIYGMRVRGVKFYRFVGEG